jgi:hypothetical protein
MATRAGMANLIARLQALLNSDPSITDDDAQQLLDDRAVFFDAPLTPRIPFYVQHLSPWENLEEGAVTIVYYGYNLMLIETTQYTVDYQRGVVTTLEADRRGLKMQSVAYDLYGAAADGWEGIAGAHTGLGGKISGLGYSIDSGSAKADALDMAQKYRALSWPRTHQTERADSIIDPRQAYDWHNARHYRAGYSR